MLLPQTWMNAQLTTVAVSMSAATQLVHTHVGATMDLRCMRMGMTAKKGDASMKLQLRSVPCLAQIILTTTRVAKIVYGISLQRRDTELNW